MNEVKLNAARQRLIDEYLKALQSDTIPWHSGWKSKSPRNAITNRSYKGVNHFLLSFIADENKWDDPRWCTFNQAKEQGWHIIRGQKAVPIEYWYILHTEEKRIYSWDDYHKAMENGADPNDFQLRSKIYHVFNAAQIEGITQLEQNEPVEINNEEFIDKVIKNMGVSYEEKGDKAFYAPDFDTVVIPEKKLFLNEYAYHATRLHELCHATGHEKRLNRDLSGNFGSESYAREELRAEISSSFLMQELNLEYDEQHTRRHIAYIQNWIEILKKEPSELFQAIKEADNITDYIKEIGEYERFINLTEQMEEARKSSFSIEIENNKTGKTEWLDLPTTNKKIEEAFVAIGLNIETATEMHEYNIIDYDEYPFYRIDPSDDIHVLNALAQSMQMVTENELDALIYYADHKDIYKNEDLTVLSIHANEIPYFTYDHNLMNGHRAEDMVLEERYGITKAINVGLMEKLEELAIKEYFDFKKYGLTERQNKNAILYENGYIDNTMNSVDITDDLKEVCLQINQKYERFITGKKINGTQTENLHTTINRLLQNEQGFQYFDSNIDTDTGYVVFDDHTLNFRLSDAIDKTHDFKNFMILSEGETNEQCMERSRRQLLSSHQDTYYEEQELTLEPEEEISISSMRI